MATLSQQLERKRRETPWLLVISVVLFWASFVFNSWTWAALSRTPAAGPFIERNAQTGSLLAWTYMKTGQWVFDLSGKPEFGVEGAVADYPTTLPQIVIENTVAVRLVLEARESFRARLLGWSHYATIPLFVLWIIFTILRPRTRKTFTRSI